ncbi:hypothetical protein RCL1_003941 [Eukaryota sp. TZLM3-RCL]
MHIQEDTSLIHKTEHPPRRVPVTRRFLFKVLFFLFLVLSLPFSWSSIILPGAFASAAGWYALLLFAVQISLGVRSKLIDRLIGLDCMWLLHRIFPIFFILSVLIHGYLKVAASKYKLSLMDTLKFMFIFNRSNEFYIRVFHGQVAFYICLILTLISILRVVPFSSKFSWLPYYIWRPLHFLFYPAFVICLPHVVHSASSHFLRFSIFAFILLIAVSSFS